MKEIIAPAKTEYERIQAIGGYVQRIKYVAIEIDLARGGGYKPHYATDVFSKQYGDCKDKANLMRAMLKQAGIDSYLVVIYAGDRNHVRREWPSPHQFNHAIIAIKVNEDVNAPSILQHSTLGRLLIFDPTSSNTPVGDLHGIRAGEFSFSDCRGELEICCKCPRSPGEQQNGRDYLGIADRKRRVESIGERAIARAGRGQAAWSLYCRAIGRFSENTGTLAGS